VGGGGGPNTPSNLVSRLKSVAYGVFLITSKVLDARRRGATTEPYGQYAASLSRASRSNERSDRRQRCPSTLLRTVSLSNGPSNGLSTGR
jgi:hypothetical protein